MTMQEELEWEMLQLYLESLNLSTTGVWVGYRYDALNIIATHTIVYPTRANATYIESHAHCTQLRNYDTCDNAVAVHVHCLATKHHTLI